MPNKQHAEMPTGSMENSHPYTAEPDEMPASSMNSESPGTAPVGLTGEMPLGKMDDARPGAGNAMPTGSMDGNGSVPVMAAAAAGGGEMPTWTMDSGCVPSATGEMPSATGPAVRGDVASSGLTLSGRWRITLDFDS